MDATPHPPTLLLLLLPLLLLLTPPPLPLLLVPVSVAGGDLTNLPAVGPSASCAQPREREERCGQREDSSGSGKTK